MVSQKVTNSLECAFSLDRHISMHPITLSCGHNVCKQCIPLNGNHKIPCYHCQKINQIDLRLCDESISAKCLFDLVLNKLFPLVEEKFKTAVNQLKDCRKLFEENLNLRIDSVKEEIEFRIGSLKEELDLLQLQLCEQVDQIKDKIFSSREKSSNFMFEIEQYEATLAKLQDDIENVSNQTEDKFYDYQNQLKEIKKIVNTALKTDYQINFASATFKIDTASIGLIEFKEVSNAPLSKILTSSKEIESLMKLCEFSQSDSLKLLYRGSEDGYSAMNFHEKCDNCTNTLAIIKSTNGYVFGGYTTQTWNATSGWKTDPYAFIFSFKNKDNKPAKMNIHKPQYAIAGLSDFLISFGGGHDICVANMSNLNMQSFSNLSNQYYLVANFTNDPINYLAGSYYFQVEDIEVYQVVTI